MAGETRTALADRAASAGAPSLPDPAALADSAALADPAALADRLRLGLVRLSRQLRRQDPPGLSVTLYSALAAVADRGELAIGELAESEGVPSSAATRIADRLEEAGYVARRPNPRDRRGVNVVITTAGRRRVERRRKRGNAWLAARLAGLTPGQRQALADALGVLDAVMAGGDEPAAAPDAAAPDAAVAAREETR
ncbi:MAG: MarR family transcriptional regulator [Actinobacteria bacterium]|nr:MarR family transcriptional regulator [Actinomycetota bacterium]